MAQWLRLGASNAGGMGLNPSQELRFPHAVRCGPPKKKNEIIRRRRRGMNRMT